jgi:peptide/nickel transport system permease protein
MLQSHPTIKHILGRAGWYFVTFLVAVTINFFLPRLGDANPIDTILARASSGSADAVAQKKIAEGSV